MRSQNGRSSGDYLYTGQRYEEGTGLYFYNARWYDPALGGFTQADSIVPQPGDVLAWDRYVYVNNNPVRFSDPSGHCLEGVSTPVSILVGGMVAGGIIGYGYHLHL